MDRRRRIASARRRPRAGAVLAAAGTVAPGKAATRAAAALSFAAALIALLAGAALPPPARAAGEPQISASLEPHEISIGQAARLTIAIANAQGAPAPQVPAIDGLAIQGTGQSTNIQIVNGRVASEVKHTFYIQATKPGEYSIPAIEVNVGGQALRTAPLSLRVTAAGSPPAAARPGSPPRPGSAGGAGTPGEPAALAMLDVALPSRDLYVGEVVPATFRLFVREGVRVTEVAPPTIGSNAFTVTRPKDGQPQQSQTSIDGVTYYVYSFPVAIGAVAAGEQSVEPKMELAAILPSQRRRRGGMFDDPFFDSFMGGTEQRKLVATGKPTPVRVLPLPAEGRPADFSGGIGKFSLAATTAPSSVTVGDPVTLTVTVTGRGNFDRVSVPPVASDADWKAYSTSTKFEPSDALGLDGKKVFEQAVIPQHAGLPGLPARRFSYFDPEAKRYVSLSTETLRLAIAPGASAPPRAAAEAASASGTAARGEARDADAASGFELAPNQIALGRLRRAAPPLARRPLFLAAQLLPILAAGLAIVWLRRRDRRAQDPAYLRRRASDRAVGEQLEALRRAAGAGETAAFFAAARRAVQECAAAASGRAAGALTDADVERALRATSHADDRAREGLVRRVRELFAAADAATYSGQGAGGGELREWQREVEALVADLRGVR